MNSSTQIARIEKGLNSYIDVSETPVYKMSTTLKVSGTGFNSSTFTLDQGITQENANRRLTSGSVASWTVGSGTTGSLVLSDVAGKFSAGGTLHSPSLNNVTVTDITEPDLLEGSGDLLYIQNIRPITRKQNQREEFRISIGF